MKEDMLDSSSDDDDNVADDDDMNYKESDTEQNNSGAIEEAEQENDDDDDTEEEEESSDDEETKTDDDNNSFAFVQDVLCSMQDKLAIPKSWILLDSQSMVDMFSNPKLLDNIHDAKQVLTLHCNAGKAIVSKRGDLKGYGTVWYHPGGITNILSLNNVQKKYKVTYDSSVNTSFIVHKTDGTNRIFMPSKKGYSSLMLGLTLRMS